MKKKHRGTIFFVERIKPRHVVVSAFASFERADAYKAECEQTYKDAGFPEDEVEFKVSIAVYYDE